MHGCPECVLPKSNLEYRFPKLELNETRDNDNTERLEALGWNVIVLCECELKLDRRYYRHVADDERTDEKNNPADINR